MHMKSHGGLCCGMTHIHRLLVSPTCPVSATVTRTMTSENLFNEEAPQESASARLDRLIDFHRRMIRQKGIIEVITAEWYTPGDPYRQYENWHPVLLEKGFVEVSSCYNSNSGNRIHVYHLCVDLAPKKKKG